MGVFSPHMKHKPTLSELEIASKVRAGKDFTVTGKKARAKVLVAKKFIGANLTTRDIGENKFQVIFL